MEFALIWGALIGLGIGIFKVISDSKEGKTGKCQFCGAKMSGRYGIEKPVCQRCGRTQPWAMKQVETLQAEVLTPTPQNSSPAPTPASMPSSTSAVTRPSPTTAVARQPISISAGNGPNCCANCGQRLLIRGGEILHAPTGIKSCHEQERWQMGLHFP